MPRQLQSQPSEVETATTGQRPAPPPSATASSTEAVMRLQSMAGNASMVRLLSSGFPGSRSGGLRIVEGAPHSACDNGALAESSGDTINLSARLGSLPQMARQFVVNHELAHVAQRRVSGSPESSVPDTAASDEAIERNADDVALAAMEGRSHAVLPAAAGRRLFGATAGKDPYGNRRMTDMVHENQTMNAAEGVGYGAADQQMFYAGNWMRDMNQLLLPMLGGRFNPKIYEVLSLVYAIHFGSVMTGGPGETPEQEFGTYDPVEHIDNPGGLTGTGVLNQTDANRRDDARNHTPAGLETEAYANLDPRYAAEAAKPQGAVANPQDLPAFQVDESAIPAYLRASRTHTITTMADAASMILEHPGDEAWRQRGLRKAGEAMHTMQDYYAHSNFVEIAINQLLAEGRAPESNPATVRQHSLLAQLRLLNPRAGTYDVNTYVQTAGGAGGNATTAGGRQIMATGTFTIQDTMYSLKEKADIALRECNPFGEGPDRPSAAVLGLIAWLQANPDYAGSLSEGMRGVQHALDFGMPAIEVLLEQAERGQTWSGSVTRQVQRGVGSSEERWHRLWGDNAAANAAAQANIRAATQTEVQHEDARRRISTLRAELRTLQIEASSPTGPQTLYRTLFDANKMVRLGDLARLVPVVGDVLAPLIDRLVEALKHAVKTELAAAWDRARQRVIAEFNAMVAEVFKTTELHNPSTSQAFTQPTHTDIAKDFDPHQHGTEDTRSYIESARRLYDRFSDAVTGRESHEAHDPHAHQHRHGGAWLASLGHDMATRASTDILRVFKQITDRPASTDPRDALEPVINRWFAHPQDCVDIWHEPFLKALTASGTDAQELRSLLADRTALPPPQQAPGDYATSGGATRRGRHRSYDQYGAETSPPP